MCHALRNQAVLGPLHSAPLLRFRQNQRPGVGPLRPRPRDHPVGNHSVYIYIVMERGTLCAQMTEGRVAAPLSHYFSAPPVLEQKRSAASFRPRSRTLTTKHIIMISSLTLKQSIVIVDFSILR